MRHFNWFVACLLLSAGMLFADGAQTVDTGVIGWTAAGGFTLDGSPLETAAYFRMTQTSGQSVTQSSETTVTLDAAVFDNKSGANLSLNHYEFPDAGYYVLTGGVGLLGVADAKAVSVVLRVNGDVIATEVMNTGVSGDVTIGVSTLVQVSAGDKVAILVLHGDTTSRDTAGTATTTFLAGHLITGVRSGVPVGAVQAYAGSVAPPGYLLCDGTNRSRTTYANLFAVLGTTWGVGDGSTTFGTPDLRGRIPVGAGTGGGLTERVLAATGGEEDHQLSVAELAYHNHTTSHYLGNVSVSGCACECSCAVGAYAHATSYAGSNTAHNTMQPFAVLNYIIKH